MTHDPTPTGTSVTSNGGSAAADRRRGAEHGERLIERGELLAVVERMLADNSFAPEALFVEGARGMGKSAFLNVCRRTAVERGWRVAMVRCAELQSGDPWAGAFAVLDALGTPVDVHEAAAVPQVLRELTPGHPWDRTMIILDDARDMDDHSWNWLVDLLAVTGQNRPKLVCAVPPRRSDAPISVIERIEERPSSQVMILAPLSLAAVSSLVQSRLVGESSGRAVAEVATVTHGNPFLVHRAIAILAASGLQPSGGPAVARDWLASPEVATWVYSQIADLPPDAANVLRAAAVIGIDADLAVIESVAGAFGGVENIGPVVDQLVERQLLTRARMTGFVLPMVASSLYADLLPSVRGEAHRLAAEQARLRHRSGAEVAMHLLHTMPSGDVEVADELIRAVRALLSSRPGLPLALALLARAEAEPPRPEQLPELRALRAEAAMLVGVEDPLPFLERALSTDGPRDAAIRTAAVIVEQTWGEPTAAAALSLLSEARTSREGSLADRTMIAIADALADGRPAASEGLLERAAVHVREVEPHGRVEDVVATEAQRLALVAGSVLRCGDEHLATIGSVVRVVLGGVPVDRMVTSPMLAAVHRRLLLLLVGSGSIDLVERLILRDAVDPSRHVERGAAPLITGAMTLERGRLDAAVASSLAAQRLAPEGSPVAAAAAALSRLARLLQSAPVGSVNIGPWIPTDGDELRHDAWGWMWAAQQRGLARAASGELDLAVADFRLAGELADAVGVTNPAVCGWRTGLSHALRRSGDLQGARRAAVDDLEAARRFGADLPIAKSLRALARVDGDAAVDLLDEAVAVLSQRTALLEQCRVELDLGAALRSVGKTVAAREWLRQAADHAVEMGADGLMNAARRELVAAGARPRRLAQTGPQSLTPAERRVAELVAGGYKNTEIAQALYVSVKTIESHLARVYDKLAIQGRAELRSVWDGLEPGSPDNPT